MITADVQDIGSDKVWYGFVWQCLPRTGDILIIDNTTYNVGLIAHGFYTDTKKHAINIQVGKR